MTDSAIEARQQRGLMIAATAKITRKGNAWLVPSQSGDGRYTVVPHAQHPVCSCPDHESTGGRCKHIFAVQYVQKREEHTDGSATVTSAIVVTEKIKRPTYPQNWPAYNAAQTNEKHKFLSLLRDMCAGLEEPPAPKTGRPPVPLADGIFAACYKVYSGFSARRFTCDLKDARDEGFVASAVHYNTVLKFLENPKLTPILKAMIVEASKSLATVEVDFAADSSGFMTSRFIRWFDNKYGTPKMQRDWCKVHITCGVKTNVVTAVVIEDRNAPDVQQLPEMIQTTAENFTVREVSADKIYGCHANYDAITKAGGIPFIPFKSNASGASGGLWQKMFHYFNFRREDFSKHYHKRSNVESTFSMIKRKFGDSLRSKTDVAMVNESLLKLLCHNIVVLIHEMYELGIEPEFWGVPTEASAHKLDVLPFKSAVSGG